ncbi:hypothetical protein M407DRAFT_20269 [Tulasnella calospora MUT 4182]|uniref:Glycoside hydrolase family 16 protein n=1 Tax=Tulasnella calospora MUT 4182 TaxID=1051891 RepID=A0A0C3MAN7_9AGAM|nr:hypothetical protein M407DRAFT_20269 [Tulasnella calospora MUT 4182]
MCSIISSLFFLATVAVVAVDGIPIDPPTDGFKLDSITPSDSARPIVGRMTNAKRLAMGLPPLKPKALRRGTRAASARRSATSMLPPILHKCNILVKNAVDGSSFGYLAPAPGGINDYYGVFQQSQAGSLEVSFYTSPDDPSPSELDFFAENAPDPSSPYFGAHMFFGIGGRELSAENGSLAGIGGDATQTQPGSPATDEWESAIWKYNPITQDITAQWINSDGSSPPTNLVYWGDFEIIGLTGNISDYQSITFTCVPPLPIQPVR